MLHFHREFKESFCPKEGKPFIFPAALGYEASEVTYVTVTMSLDLITHEWCADIDVYGFPLTAKGVRDKRVRSAARIFGLFSLPERKAFVKEYVTLALQMHGLKQSDLTGCDYLFQD
jgi:hypothetical protein